MKAFIVLCSIVACVLASTREEVKRFATRKERPKRATCTSEYLKYGQQKGTTHTMCKYNPVTSGSVSSSEIEAIVDKHNELRSDPKTSVTAKAMCKLYWDPNIAKVAQHFANACPTYGEGHDKLRSVPGYGISVGQNLAWGHTSWTHAIQDWFNEVKDFAFGEGSTNGNAVGHYTQIVRDTTCRIGCGFANCGGTRTYVCNYATGQPDVTNPFKPGASCSSCPKKCSNNLCDCGGKMCYNGGTLDYNNCTCTCPSMYSGESCEIMLCPGPDESKCGKPQPYGYPPSYCQIYTNVPEECPVMCGTCNADGSAGTNFIPAPAAQLEAGSSGTATNGPAGSAERAPEDENAGNTGPNCETVLDRHFCTSWIQQEWCLWGDNMSLTYNGEKGTPYSFCPWKCGACQDI